MMTQCTAALPLRLARPLKGAVGKMDFHAPLQKVSPENADLFPLGNGIGGDKGGFDGRIIRHIVRGLAIPGGDKIQHSRAFHIGEDARHVGFLRRALLFLAAKRRIAQDVA